MRGLRLEPTKEGGATRERGGTPWHLRCPDAAKAAAPLGANVRPDPRSGQGSAVPAGTGPARALCTGL